MSDINHLVWCKANDWSGGGACNCGAASELAPAHGSSDIPNEGLWRCTADDDKEKEWDSTTAQDALIDAEEAIANGAIKVVIQRISPPNGEL